MKLSSIALSIVVISGAVITGGSWYSGTKAEQKYTQFITESNKAFLKANAYGIYANINNVVFKRSFFTSDITYNIEIKHDEKSIVFPVESKLYHGPIPLNRLTKLNLMPVMFSEESKVLITDASTTALKDFFNTAELLTSNLNVNYSGEFGGDLIINAISHQDSNMMISPIKITLDGIGQDIGKVSFNIPSISLSDSTGEGKEFKIDEFSGNYTFKSSPEFTNLFSGSYDTKIKTFSFPTNPETKDILSFKNIVFVGNSKFNDKRFETNGHLNTEIEMLIKDEQKLLKIGKFYTDTGMNVDATHYDTLMGHIYSGYRDLSNLDNELMTALTQNLITNDFQYNIKSFSLENEKGKSNISLDLNINKFDPSTLNNIESILTILKNSKFDLNVNIASLQQVITQILSISPNTRSTAEATAKEQMASLVEQAKTSGMLQVENDNILLKLEIGDNGQVKLNNNVLSEEEVQTTLFLMALLAGAGSSAFEQ